MQTVQRCVWAMQYPIFLPYHDEEWGVPLFDSQRLFALLVLEYMQAGLSWQLILQKRQAFEQNYDHFQPEIIAGYQSDKINALLRNPDVIRNRAKIEATIHNAKAYLMLYQRGITLSEVLWDMVAGEPIINHWRTQQQVPAVTPLAEKLAKRLKQLGFKFVGPTTCYAFMQAMGMVDDHLIDCFCHTEQRSIPRVKVLSP
ncbi:MAG: DNA-3-methyladenine glycosylase I [Gammaproteobacteria bacterium]